MVFHTTKVVNSPGQVEKDIQQLRLKLHYFLLEAIRQERDEHMAAAHQEAEKKKQEYFVTVPNGQPMLGEYSQIETGMADIANSYARKSNNTTDPTALIIIDEADRLRITSLDQLRDIFDRGGTGVILIGMPGIEKRLSRYPQFSSRVGFVHEYRTLKAEDVRHLLKQRGWLPANLNFPVSGLDDQEVVAAILRVTEGNFRLLHRLMTQIIRILDLNTLTMVTEEVVEVARESLVIG